LAALVLSAKPIFHLAAKLIFVYLKLRIFYDSGDIVRRFWNQTLALVARPLSKTIFAPGVEKHHGAGNPDETERPGGFERPHCGL
jgi:hypothetical protein